MRELHLLLLRNFIETVLLRGIKGSMISTFLHHCHYFWTHESGLQYRVSGQQEFPREFPSFQGDSPKILCLCPISVKSQRICFILFRACTQKHSGHFCLFRIFYFSRGTVLYRWEACGNAKTPILMPSKQYSITSIGFILYTTTELF